MMGFLEVSAMLVEVSGRWVIIESRFTVIPQTGFLIYDDALMGGILTGGSMVGF
jgi:hypothetical protein